MTQMYGPAARCKRFRQPGRCGLASMYPVSDWSVLCSGPSWISARVRSHYRTGLDRGHSGHQCSHALGRPNLHLVSSSRRPRRVGIWLGHRSFLTSRCSFVRAWWSFLRPGPQNVDRVARKGRSRPAVALGLRLAPALPGCALTAPSTARGSSGSDAYIVSPRQLEGASFSQHRPGDAGKLVGERDRQHVVVQSPL